jgi:hypothetical protein
MNFGRIFVVGLAAWCFLAALPFGEGHGASRIMTQDVGAYHVTFYTFDEITLEETVRIAWNVTDATSRQRVHVDEPRIEVRRFNLQGALVNRTVEPLQQRSEGFLFADITMGPPGKVRFLLPLPGANASFEQIVCDFDERNRVVCGAATTQGRANTPLPPWAPFVAVLWGLVAARRPPER